MFTRWKQTSLDFEESASKVSGPVATRAFGDLFHVERMLVSDFLWLLLSLNCRPPTLDILVFPSKSARLRFR